MLELFEHRRKRIWAAVTIRSDSPVYQIARQAVLAGTFEVTLEGDAHEPKTDVHFKFKAEGQLVNGRVGSEIKADFKSTNYVEIAEESEALPQL